ncbi:unnamed protein product [Absidia cylindrospora]
MHSSIMTLPIPSSSSSSSLQLTVEQASHRFSFGPSDSDTREQAEPHAANIHRSEANSNVSSPSTDNTPTKKVENTGSNKSQRQQQQRKTWTPSSLSLKPFRTKPSGRNSLPSINTRKKRYIPSTFGELFSSSTLSSRDINALEPDKTPDTAIPYRLSTFPFEPATAIDYGNTSSSSTTSRSSSTSSSSFSRSVHSLSQSLTTSNSADNTRFSSSCILAPQSSKHQVGQLLFGTPIIDDPFFFKKEFYTMINNQQQQHPLALLNQKKDTCTDVMEMEGTDVSPCQRKRQDDGLFLLKTMNLQRLLDDCEHIGQTTSQWMYEQKNTEQQDEEVIQLTMEWGYTNCNRILEQYNRLLAPESQIGDDNRKAWYSDIQCQLEQLENDIQDDDPSATGLETLVHSLARLIYDGILLTNYGRMVVPNKDYWVEGNNQCDDQQTPSALSSSSSTTSAYTKIDHQDAKASWYSELFVGKPYSTFIGYKDTQPVVLSVLWDTTANNYRCIFRSTLGPGLCSTIDINHSNKEDQDKESSSSLPFIQAPTMTKEWEKAIEDAFDIDLSQLIQVDAIFMDTSGFELDLIRLDKDTIHHQFKCGVLYIKMGQCNEDEWFSNDCGSESFHYFLDCLGEKIPLKGYQGWAAGLDTKSGDSGDYTYTSTWQDIYQVTYHVSTLIPSSSNDKQHIQKKRHIGNDIVCIVFVDGNRPFDPAAIKSQFLHVFIVVHQEEWYGRICWRVEVTCVKDVPLFGPSLSTQVFFDTTSLHDFLLAKLINAEYAALKAPKFTKPLDRARQGILTNVVERTLKMQHINNNTNEGKRQRNNSNSSSNNNNNNNNNMKPLSRNAHVISFPTFRTTPTTGPTILLKDLLSSDGFVGSLGRRKSAQDSLLTSYESKLHFNNQGQQPVETMESAPVLDITEIRPSRSSQAILQSDKIRD